MKKYLALLLLIPTLAFAETLYVVEWKVVDGKKVQNSSYTVESVYEIDTGGLAYTLVTAEEYAKLGHGSNWEVETTNWLKTPANVTKVDTAISEKPMTKDDIIADLTARLEALEAK